MQLGRGKYDLTFPRWDKILDSLKPVLLHPPGSLCIQAVVQRGSTQLPASLEVPAGNFQITHEGCNGNKDLLLGKAII